MSYSYSVCYCYECVKIDLSDKSPYDPSKYYCSEYKMYVNKNDHACSKYFVYNEALKRNDCFITTALCDILNLSDDNIYLNKLRGFRENYMRYDTTLIPLLVEYDIVGPAIAYNLKNDIFKDIKSLMLLELYIKPICKLLDNKEYTSAISKYKTMTNELIESYNLDIKEYDINDIDLNNIGKGHKIKLKTKEA